MFDVVSAIDEQPTNSGSHIEHAHQQEHGKTQGYAWAAQGEQIQAQYQEMQRLMQVQMHQMMNVQQQIKEQQSHNS